MSFIERFCKTNFKSYEDFYTNFKIKVPKNFNYGYDVIDAIAAETPDAPALVWCNDQGEEKRFTFQAMKEWSDKAANFFKGQGIGKGDFVMLLMKRHYMYWVCMMGLHKIGAVTVPATAMLTVKDLAYRIEAADIKMVLAAEDEEVWNNIDEAQKKTGDTLKIKAAVGAKNREGYLDLVEEVEKASSDWERPTGEQGTENTDLMLVYFTSGTTGMPKMVMHNFIYPLGHILTGKFWHDLHAGDLSLSVADTGWAKCSWGKMYGQWMSEAALFVYDYGTRFKPIDLVRVATEHKVTVFCAPPTIYRFLIHEDLSGYDFSSLRRCCTAGEPLNPEVFNRWKELTGLEIKEGFGQTESPIIIGTFPWVEPRLGSTGRPSPHLNAKIIDEEGQEVPDGDRGEICIDVSHGVPAGLTVGYYKDEERTKKMFEGGWYHTGDMAWRDEDGYIWFEGRADDVIKCSGYRIGPFEVESALIEHPAVLEAAITAVPDPIRGQVVKATIVLTKEYRPSDELVKELQNHVKKATAPYKYPRIVEFVDELPKTSSGKIKRVDIRNKDAKQ